jgi:hypothetical protein
VSRCRAAWADACLGSRTVAEVEYLFVVTYGRSGSTLVMGLLNELPATLVRGENGFFVRPLYESWKRVREVQDQFAAVAATKGPLSAFFGVDEIDSPAFLDDLRELVTRQLLGTHTPESYQRVGFKEVLWHEVADDESTGFLEFMDRAFPGCRYVAHRRDFADVRDSGFWRRRPEAAVHEAVERVLHLQDLLLDSRPERTLRTTYEHLTDPGTRRHEVERLQRFVLGSVDDGVTERMLQAMDFGYGPRPFGRSKQ